MGYFQNTSSKQKKQENEILLQIPGCTVHLMDKGEAVQLAKGDFMLVRILEKGLPIATIIKVRDDLQWPLTRDEPVLKLDYLHYLFSILIKDGDPLNYGVTFSDQYSSNLPSLDSFLRENACFSFGATSTNSKHIEWKQFASRIDDYNDVLAKAIAGGSGQIVRGIFVCSNAYISQVQNGGEVFLQQAQEEKNRFTPTRTNSTKNAEATGVNESLKRARNISKMTDNLSKAVLDGVGAASGFVVSPLVNSQAGKAFLATPTGQVLLASLVAFNAILDAAEVAGKQALSATSTATTRMVTNKFGESAGEATEDVLATAGHCASTAWNFMKIRKAINPASSLSTGLRINAGKDNKLMST